MSWKLRKDRTELVAEGRVWIDAPPRKHYYSIYLWGSTAALNAAQCADSVANSLQQPNWFEAADDGAALAIVCHSNRRIRVHADGTETEIVRPKLGEMHFEQGNWPMDMVAHECLHVALGSADLGPDLRDLKDQEGTAEEVLCYRLGATFDAVYRWLWEVDPSDGWEAVEAPAVRVVA